MAQQRVRLKCAAERSKKLLAQRMDSEQQPRVPLGGNLRAAVAGSRHDEEFSGYTHTHRQDVLKGGAQGRHEPFVSENL